MQISILMISSMCISSNRGLILLLVNSNFQRVSSGSWHSQFWVRQSKQARLHLETIKHQGHLSSAGVLASRKLASSVASWRSWLIDLILSSSNVHWVAKRNEMTMNFSYKGRRATTCLCKNKLNFSRICEKILVLITLWMLWILFSLILNWLQWK